jgi:glycine/D-amino acid oxidase-like deaminating enzyme/nitrite reductase/ring-hydroxylating ferredoxin subunit
MALDTTPYWVDSSAMPKFPTLARDLAVDVVVVGAGITGITAAYLLKSQGRRVALVERGRCGGVDTSYTTAHLTYVTDQWLGELVETLGEDHARAVWDAGRAAIAQIDENIQTEHIACAFEWVPGYLHAPITEATPKDASVLQKDASVLQKEARLASGLGFEAQYIEAVPFAGRPGVMFASQARFHPLRYLAGLVTQIAEDGSHVFEQTEVTEVREQSVKAGGHTIKADYVVIATHDPMMGKASYLSATLLQTKLFLYSTYVVGGTVPGGTIPDALFWDTGNPYYYLRLVDRERGRDRVILGGADHRTGQVKDTKACYQQVEDQLRRLVPEVDVTDRWSGQVIDTHDGLPYIGEIAERQFVATGFAGNGMTFGTLAGMMACDAAMGRTNPWRELFDVGRATVRTGAWDYVKENASYPYYMIRDRFAGPEGKSLRDVKSGEGKVLEINGERVAASRDEEGRLSLVSAVCTHMGCLVAWNSAEGTWDCPCHGSRFTAAGDVMAGPAETRLKAVDVSKDTHAATRSR